MPLENAYNTKSEDIYSMMNQVSSWYEDSNVELNDKQGNSFLRTVRLDYGSNTNVAPSDSTVISSSDSGMVKNGSVHQAISGNLSYDNQSGQPILPSFGPITSTSTGTFYPYWTTTDTSYVYNNLNEKEKENEKEKDSSESLVELKEDLENKMKVCDEKIDEVFGQMKEDRSKVPVLNPVFQYYVGYRKSLEEVLERISVYLKD